MTKLNKLFLRHLYDGCPKQRPQPIRILGLTCSNFVGAGRSMLLGAIPLIHFGAASAHARTMLIA